MEPSQVAEQVTVDVAVIGAGPAGSAAAIVLAEAGWDVALIDKAVFPRDKICGDGLTTGALRILERLGVSPSSIASWTPVSDIHVSGPRQHVVTFPLPKDQGHYAVITRRMDLDNALVDRARELGVKVIEGASVTAIADVYGSTSNGVVALSNGVAVSARSIVAADGMWSPTRKMLGTAETGYLGEWHAFRQYFTNVGPKAKDLWVWFEEDLLPGYFWVFPLPDGRANVGFGIMRGAKISTKEMKALWPQLLARPHIAEVLGPDAVAEDRHQAWPIPARVGELALFEGRVLWAGDAAAVTDPMTGEGIGQALLTGVLAAEAIMSRGSVAEIAQRYDRLVRRELVADHKMSMLLVRALGYGAGARAAIRIAGLTQWTRKNFARWLFEDEPRAVALTPRRWHRKFLKREGAYRGPSTERR